MTDITFDPVARDLVIQNGDFVETTNPSVQNGAILRDAKCFSILESYLWHRPARCYQCAAF